MNKIKGILIELWDFTVFACMFVLWLILMGILVGAIEHLVKGLY